MSDFDRAVKYLDLRRASQDTTQNTKPLSLSKARAIKKLHLAFTVPGFNVPNPGFGTLFRQYNYTASQDFYIFDVYGYSPGIIVFAMCVRYRVGGTVYRYRLPSSKNTNALSVAETNLANAVQAAPYNNEIIKANFCIEFWSSAYPVNIAALGDYVIRTNLIRNPITPDESGDVIGWSVVETMDRDALDNTFNEALPTPYASGSQWLTN